ncbi:MAG: hypothetical protein WA602_14455 [Silvibacterium sp.]
MGPAYDLGESSFSGWRTAIETEEKAAARELKRGFRPDVLDGLAGDIEGDEGNDLNGLMCGDAERAVGVDVAGGMAVDHLHDSDHQDQRDAYDPEQSYPGGARVQP